MIGGMILDDRRRKVGHRGAQTREKTKSEKWLKRLSQIRYPAVKMTSFEPPKGHENVTQWGGRFNQKR